MKNLMLKNAPNIKSFSYDIETDKKTIKKEFFEQTKVDVCNGWEIALITKCMVIAFCTKNYNWNEYEYQKGVSDPYQKIRIMKEDLEREGKQTSIEQN